MINLCWQDTYRRFISSTCMQASTRSSTGFMGCTPAILCLTCAPITAWRKTWTLLRRWSRWAVSHTVAFRGGFSNTWDSMKLHYCLLFLVLIKCLYDIFPSFFLYNKSRSDKVPSSWYAWVIYWLSANNISWYFVYM